MECIDCREEFKETIEELRKSAEELRVIFENSYDGIYITDGDGNTLRVNRAYEKITGLDRNNLIGRNMKDIVNEGLISKSITFMIQEQRKPITITQIIRGEKEILVSGVPVFDQEGKLIRVITSVRDMTELNNTRNELIETSNLAEGYKQELIKLSMLQGRQEFIFNSKVMFDIYDLALRIAKVDSTVLIYGESGVGKEVVANVIHEQSPRSQNGSFIKLNCGAIPSDLLESELFGYEEGAFTGAKKSGKMGIFELADGGTLFLDEIGNLSLSLQAKLLRVLQFQEFMRIGGVEPKKIDTRLIAATSKNLDNLLETGEFRKDLYYRLHVVPITIPPLRERPEDILPIMFHYLKIYNNKYSMDKTLSHDARELMINYQWPGNVRELKNCIERILVISKGSVIQNSDLPNRILSSFKNSFTQLDELDSLKNMLDHVEKDALIKAFNTHRSTRKVAYALGISQSAVIRKIKKHNLSIDKKLQ